MIKGVLIYLFSVFVSSCAQILLKKSTQETHTCTLKEYLNIKVVCAYMILLCATLITIYAYHFITLSTGTVLESCGYAFVAILSSVFLNEEVGRKKKTGILLIIIGVLIFNKG